MKKIDGHAEPSSNIVYQNLLDSSKPTLTLFNGTILYEDSVVPEFTFFDTLKMCRELCPNSFINNYPIPHIVHNVIGSNPQLEAISYDKETIQHLNTKGLHIYIYDVITFDIMPTRYFATDTIDPNIHSKIYRTALVGFENYMIGPASTFSYELESIRKFVKTNQLTNVTVFLQDYKIEDFAQKNYPEFKLRTKSFMFNFTFVSTNQYEVKKYEHNFNLKLEEDFYSNIEKKFLSFSRRCTGYRHLLTAFLLTKSSDVSFHKNLNSPFYDLDSSLWFNFKKWKNNEPQLYNTLLNGIDIINKKPSHLLDVDTSNLRGLDNFIIPKSVFQKSFCNVVAESKFAHPTGFITDKTLDAIKMFRPFILVAPPYTLEYLRSIGIKTFSKYWDESYDTELNHEKRLIKIFKLIDYIDSLSIDDLKLMYRDMIPILEHNYKTIPIDPTLKDHII